MRLLIAGILAGFLLAAAPQPTTLRTTLANGMKVVILPDDLAPVVTTVMTYGVGSDDDTMPGIAHATEHMMFRGTADVSAAQLAVMAARAGADYDASTSNTATQYYFKLPASYTGLALRLEADRMTGALDTASDWASERGPIEQEVRAHESVPGASVFAKMRRAVFGDTPYAEDGVGTIESFQRMRASDIAAFYHTWYHPNNATLVVSGNIDPQRVLTEIGRDFDAIPEAAIPQHRTFSIAAISGTTIRDTVAELPVPVSALAFRMPALTDKDYLAGQMLMLALNNVRGGLGDLQTKGQILGAGAIAGAYPEVGTMIVVGFGLPGTQPQQTQDAIESVLDEYRAKGVPDDLVESAKLRLLSEQDRQRSSISGLAFSWAGALSLGYDSPRSIFDEAASVTPSDVDRVAREYLDPQESISMQLEPKNLTAMPHADPNAGAENVKYTPDKEGPLPAWASTYFAAPLQVPQSDSAVRTFLLPNGMKLTVRRETLAPTIVLQGLIRTSPELYEPKGKDGVAEITSTLLDWGTTTYDRAAFQAQQDAIAASVSLGPSFGLDVQSGSFDRAMQLLADGMLHPAFTPAAFAVVKSNASRTLAAVEHQPRTQAEIAQVDALYPRGDPRRRRATAQTVGAVTIDDVRKWYAFAYRPDLTTIAIVGDVDPQQAQAEVERYFGSWRASGPKPSFRYPKIVAKQSRSVTVTSPASTQSDVTLTQVIDVHRGDADYIPLQLADTVLSGEGPGSMLFRDVREKRGYVYDISSNMDIGRTSSTFSIDFASDPKNVERAQAAAVAVVKRLQTTPLAVEDLQRAKALLLAQRVLPLDSYDGIASDILDAARSGLTPGESDAFWTDLLQTTPDQVEAAMRRWVRPNQFTRVMVAPGS